MDKARLRENTRIVRTLSGELRAAIEPRKRTLRERGVRENKGRPREGGTGWLGQ